MIKSAAETSTHPRSRVRWQTTRRSPRQRSSAFPTPPSLIGQGGRGTQRGGERHRRRTHRTRPLPDRLLQRSPSRSSSSSGFRRSTGKPTRRSRRASSAVGATRADGYHPDHRLGGQASGRRADRRGRTGSCAPVEVQVLDDEPSRRPLAARANRSAAKASSSSVSIVARVPGEPRPRLSRRGAHRTNRTPSPRVPQGARRSPARSRPDRVLPPRITTSRLRAWKVMTPSHRAQVTGSHPAAHIGHHGQRAVVNEITVHSQQGRARTTRRPAPRRRPRRRRRCHDRRWTPDGAGARRVVSARALNVARRKATR